MKAALDQQLRSQFPGILEKEQYFSFDCGDGWYKLLEDLLAGLSPLILAEYPNCKILQIKEKFGGLRCYMDGETSEMSALIRAAENRASETCEVCGVDKGVTLCSPTNWIRNLCRPCFNKIRDDREREKHGKV